MVSTSLCVLSADMTIVIPGAQFAAGVFLHNGPQYTADLLQALGPSFVGKLLVHPGPPDAAALLKILGPNFVARMQVKSMAMLLYVCMRHVLNL